MFQTSLMVFLHISDSHRSFLRLRHLRRFRPHYNSTAHQQKAGHSPLKTPRTRRLAPHPRLLLPDRRHRAPPLRNSHRLPDRSNQSQPNWPLRRRRLWHHGSEHPAGEDQIFRAVQLGLFDLELDNHLCGQVWLFVVLSESGPAAARDLSVLESCGGGDSSSVSFFFD